jgi:hypothetical protein
LDVPECSLFCSAFDTGVPGVATAPAAVAAAVLTAMLAAAAAAAAAAGPRKNSSCAGALSLAMNELMHLPSALSGQLRCDASINTMSVNLHPQHP